MHSIISYCKLVIYIEQVENKLNNNVVVFLFFIVN